MQNWELFPYFPSVRDFGQNRTAFMYEGGQPVYVDNLGDGIKYGFAAITLACNKHNSALLLEEIETHQHPGSLKMLIKFLVEIAKENSLQLFVSTQSPDALRYFKLFYPETRVFLIERDPNENVVHANDEEDQMRILREVGWDFGDLLRYEQIAIVDGMEDGIIIENLFEKMRGYTLESEGIKPFCVRGGSKNFGEMVRKFAASSRKLIIIKDLDEMKALDDVVVLVASWLKLLKDEGWTVQENDQEVTGEHHTSGRKLRILKSKILKAGNPQRFPEYERHSMTDYILEMVLDNPKIASEIKPEKDLSEYKLTAKNSKDELECLFGKYNMDFVNGLMQYTSKDMIPNSLRNDIISAL